MIINIKKWEGIILLFHLITSDFIDIVTIEHSESV